MIARATKLWNDLKEGVTRNKGDAFKVSEERFKEINTAGHGTLAEEIVIKDLTAKQLKELLDQMGIEYNPKAKKSELIELVGD